MIVLAEMILRISDVWVCAVWMSVNPNHSEVRVGLFNCADCCWPYWVITSNCKQQILRFFACNGGSFLMQASKQRSQNIKISDSKRNFGVQILLILFQSNITIINNVNSIIFVKCLKKSGMSQKIWALLHPSHKLTLRNGCTQISQLFDIGNFTRHYSTISKVIWIE